MIEVDIPSVFPIEYDSISNIKKLVRLVCSSHPYTPNVKELLQRMDMGENYKGLYRFLDYLHKAKILNVMRAKTKGDNIFTKPEKVYLNNTNLHSAYCDKSQKGTVREVFFASMLIDTHNSTIPKRGDFLVNDQYTFEVGGSSKGFKQIKDLSDSFGAADDIEIGSGNKIPLWLFGFLY